MKPEAGSEGTFKQCNGQWVPCNESCSTYIEWSETIWLEYWKTLDLEDCDVFIRAVNTVPLLCQHFWQNKPVRCTDEMMRPLFIQAFVYSYIFVYIRIYSYIFVYIRIFVYS